MNFFAVQQKKLIDRTSNAKKNMAYYVGRVRDCDDDINEQRVCAGRLYRALYDEKNKLAAIGAGAVNVLAAALKMWKDPIAKTLCVESVSVLASNNLECKKNFAEANIFEMLVNFLFYTNEYNYRPATFALLILTTANKEGLQQLRDVPGVIEIIEDVSEENDCDDFATLLKDLRPLSPTGKKTKAAR